MAARDHLEPAQERQPDQRVDRAHERLGAEQARHVHDRALATHLATGTLGPRGFAVVGGAVTALGVILLFVLAANRGWITPGMRVAFGAVVSASAVGAGFWVRRRYGQMLTSVGAVGAGIAGGYASLAAATAHYDLVPDWLALPLAASSRSSPS